MMTARIFSVPCLIALALASSPQVRAGTRWSSLAGDWRFALDPNNVGVAQKWFERSLTGSIPLPGTTDENQKGPLNTVRETGRLTRNYPYYGAAWYQQDLETPLAWNGKRLGLFLERTKTSTLWVDGKLVGTQNSLVAPHAYYLLSPSGPERHQLTLRISNTEHPPIGDPHQISDQTQTNWNGIIGKIGVIITDPVWIEDMQLYPDAASGKVRVRIEIGNSTGRSVAGTLVLGVAASTGGSPKGAPSPLLSVRFTAAGPEPSTIEAVYDMGPGTAGWNEFSPALHTLSVSLAAMLGKKSYADQQEVSFGMRALTAPGRHFVINGKTAFLRGKVDNCVFPLTGYPPMDVDGWVKVFRIAKAYGLNHYRFHSWCPPEAAFQAADESGIYIQAELPNWKAFGEPEHDDFLRAEGERILKAFGNHPSFLGLSLGNELGGKQSVMAQFVKHFREIDGRHLYLQGSNNWFNGPDEGDDYLVSFQVGGKKIRGSFATVDLPLGHVQTGPPATEVDYSAAIERMRVPVVSHEIGEYQVAPDLGEIEKYTGVLRAFNLEAMRKHLQASVITEQAQDFLRASGALAVRCYREDIEAALRTQGFGGFELLDLQDFSGQGTALVGILNAFMESKGFIEPAQWREFCAETVPLLRFAKYTWTNQETFHARAEVANYGPAEIPKTVAHWILRHPAGRTLAEGDLPAVNVPQGSVTALGEIQVSLETVPSPSKLNLELTLAGTNIKNSYELWVYPNQADTLPAGTFIARTIDQEMMHTLQAGGRVLLLPEPVSLRNSIEGSFASDFWNFGMFRKLAEERKARIAPGTLGILCDPKHPAFQSFPTEFHSNWQWFHLLRNSRAMNMEAMPPAYHPVLQVIDNYERALKLGTIFEARIGNGKILVCAIDLPGLQDKPEARQLLHSLLQYTNSAQFAPAVELDEAGLRKIVQ